MRVLVTGAGGFLGQAVVRRLHLAGGYELWPLNRRSRGVANEIVADLTDAALADLLPPRVDLIIHAGAYVPEKESMAEADLAVKTNAEATLRLLEYAVKAGAKRFVYVSSAAVYGVSAAAGAIDERVEPRPDNFYALSKFAGELMLEPYRFVHGIETIGLRFSYIYGKGMRASSVVRKFASLAQSDSAIPLLNSGNDYFDLIHLDDAVRAVEAAMQLGTGVYNIGSGRPTSVLELATALIAVNESSSVVKTLPATGNYPSKYLDITRAVTELSWRPQVDLMEGLREL